MHNTAGITVAVALLAVIAAGCKNSREMELEKIIAETEKKAAPLQTAANEAYWQGTLTGSEAAFADYTEKQLALKSLYSDRRTFQALKAIKESGMVGHRALVREMEVLYDRFLANQADTALLRDIAVKESALEQKYASFRAEVGGGRIDDNKVEEILHKSTDSKELQTVWEAHKKIGEAVAPDIIEVVKLRNELARSLGFDNYHTMSLELSGQDPGEVSKILDEMDSLSRDAFSEVKGGMDSAFSARYGVAREELMPWHYQGRYFQEAPDLYPVDLDKYYQGKSPDALVLDFYGGIGIDLDSIMAKSDIYPREGKNQHAFCTDIDSNGDIRVLANCVPGESWTGTMLHEFGHAAYAQGHDRKDNPFFLRDAAHAFTTEGIAMMFGRLSRNPEWMTKMTGISETEKDSITGNCILSARLYQLVFSRWVQVVYRFEESMYADPEQDLDALWWRLVEKYQMLKTPEGRSAKPDWASKIHIALYPCYYHNYLLGELFASQIHHYIVTEVLDEDEKCIPTECYAGKKEVGKWLKENIFQPGCLYTWDELTMRATGERLTARYWKEQFTEGGLR